MIRFIGERHGRMLWGLGITKEEWGKLLVYPVVLRGDDMGVPNMDVLVFVGDSNEEMKAGIETELGMKISSTDVDRDKDDFIDVVQIVRDFEEVADEKSTH